MPSDSIPMPIAPRDAQRWQSAQQQLLAGLYDSAIPAYRALTRSYPLSSELWFELGNAAVGSLNFALANTAYRRALELAPKNHNLCSLIGQQFLNLRQLDDARFCYERAVAIAPDSVDARINLAVWFEKERRLEQAWEQVEACLARHPRDDQARYFRALLLHRKKQYAEAETALRDLIKDGPAYPYVKYAAPHLLGVVLDQLDQPDEAMRWLLAAKTQVRTITDIAALEQAYDATDAARREILSGLTPEMLRRWRGEAPLDPGGHRLAFLGGHPRSGTTLLEQVLDANPEVLAFDEPVSFHQEIEKQINFRPGTHPALQLDALPPSWRRKRRQRYIQSLLREVADPRSPRTLLDKNPSLTMSLNTLLRAFPDVKVIIALRDPRDVIISCFFLNIMLNATNVNFLSLERTAKHYADLMDTWLRLRDMGGFDWMESRYEDTVADVEAEGRKVTAFLGLEWHSNQSRSYETARRKVLYAPTYHDVTQPVYKRAVGRWQRYAAALEPIQSKLAPYCQRLGY